MKKLITLALLSSLALSTPSMAQGRQHWQPNPYGDRRGGVDTGTVVAVGVAGVVLGAVLADRGRDRGYERRDEREYRPRIYDDPGQWEHHRSRYERRYIDEGCYWYQGYYYRPDGYYYHDRWYPDNGYGYRHYYRYRNRGR